MMPWAIFNTNRPANTPPLDLALFLHPLTAQRLGLTAKPAEPPPPADPAASWKPGMPVPAGYHYGKFGLVKLAAPGQRYPSKRPAGVADDIIERIDAYSARVSKGSR